VGTGDDSEFGVAHRGAGLVVVEILLRPMVRPDEFAVAEMSSMVVRWETSGLARQFMAVKENILWPIRFHFGVPRR